MDERDRLRAVVRQVMMEALRESLDPAYTRDLDRVSDGLQGCLKALEDAHARAPDPASKTIVAGLHSDLFNAASQARGFLHKLKSS